MFKSFIRGLFMAVFVLFVTACGGGDPVMPEPEVVMPPTVTVTVPVVVSDVTLSQVATSLVVTPGETFRATLLTISCPLAQGTIDICARSVPLGEIGFEIGLELVNSKVMYNGNEIRGYWSKEGSLYRFSPLDRVEMWQTGSIELVSTLSPTAKTGEVSLVVVHVVSASFDKTLELTSGVANVSVLALPHNAPAVMLNASPESFEGKGKVVSSFDYTCPQTVTAGCTLTSFNIIMYGFVLQSDVWVLINENLYLQGQAWSSENLQFVLIPNYWVQAGTTATIKVVGVTESVGYIWFDKIGSKSGDKEIAPLLPTMCTAVSTMYCKG